MRREWGDEMLNFTFKQYNILYLLSNITHIVYVVCQPLVQVFMNNNLSLWITVPHKAGTIIIPTLQMERLKHGKFDNLPKIMQL